MALSHVVCILVEIDKQNFLFPSPVRSPPPSSECSPQPPTSSTPAVRWLRLDFPPLRPSASPFLDFECLIQPCISRIRDRGFGWVGILDKMRKIPAYNHES